MSEAVRANGPDGAGPSVPGLENTGERYLPGAEGTTEQSYDHISRYRLAERYVAGKEIVDLGCGTGYGSYWLSGAARHVVGVDLSEEAISYAAHRYRAPNLRYGTGDVTNLPYRDGTFEAAVSFEVIEHLPRPEDLVMEAKRLIREDGLFLVSTPDKQTYSNDRNSVNRFHLKEMYAPEFRELLERHFEHVRIYRQGAVSGSIIFPEPDALPEDGRLEVESARFSLPEQGFGRELPTTLFMVAVCTNGKPPEALERPYLALDRDRQIYEEYVDLDSMMGHLLNHQKYLRLTLSNQLEAEKTRVERLREQVWKMQKERKQLQERLQERLQTQLQSQDRRSWIDQPGMQNSRVLKAARRLIAANARVRSLLGRR